MTKKSLKQFLFTYETNITGIISNSLVHSVPKAKTINLIKRETARISAFLRLSRAETNFLWIKSQSMYNKVSKRLFSTLAKLRVEKGKPGYDEILAQRRDKTYECVRDMYIYPGELEKAKNDVADSVESRLKREAVYDVLRADSSRNSPFYICDAHKNPALGHADSEGKIYYDADWRSYITDESTASKIQSYIQNHQLQSVQYIIGAPTYLVTRKNCRHRLHNIAIKEVLSSSATKILKKHNLYLKHIEPESYEHAQYRKYYERMKTLQAVRNLSESKQLESDIARTRQLMLKWSRAEIERKKKGS